MQTFKPNEMELAELKPVVALLKASNGILAEAEKNVKAAKEKICEWLKSKRGVDVGGLAIGDLVHVEGALMIEVSKMCKFDEKDFLLKHPAMHAEFKRDRPVTKYKPLV